MSENYMPEMQNSAPQGGGSKRRMIMVAVGVVVILAIGALIGYAFTRQSATKDNDTGNQNEQTNTNNDDDSIKPGNTDTGHPEPLVSGMIEWKYPERTYVEKGRLLTIPEEYIYVEEPVYYIVGKFLSGKYKDQYLLTVLSSCDGLCIPPSYRIVVDRDRNPSKVTLLTKYSDEVYEGDFVNRSVPIDSEFTIPDLEFPKTLTPPQPRQTLSLVERAGFYRSIILFNSTGLKLVYNDAKVGAVYTTSDNPDSVDGMYRSDGFYSKAPDSSLIFYEHKLELLPENNKVPNVTWTGNVKNTAAYVYTDRTGCGSTNYASVARNVKMSDLVQTGTTNKGEPVYEFKDSNHSILKAQYDTEYFVYEGTKKPYEEFIKGHPIFFWKDAFNRLIKFEAAEFQSPAECGKPVIYLYPRSTTKVDVKIEPVGGFTYTEPAYDNGWTVVAKPNGELTEVKSGKTYPYLFWEGHGGLYQIPDKGFVVKQSELSSFLSEKLTKAGLNAQEIKDFKEYWLPYMDESPYYFVTFQGKQSMDRIAPLTITPKPDTVIRILMDFKPLQAPIEVEGYDIKTPERKGFTVVEWGGVKH